MPIHVDDNETLIVVDPTETAPPTTNNNDDVIINDNDVIVIDDDEEDGDNVIVIDDDVVNGNDDVNDVYTTGVIVIEDDDVPVRNLSATLRTRRTPPTSTPITYENVWGGKFYTAPVTSPTQIRLSSENPEDCVICLDNMTVSENSATVHLLPYIHVCKRVPADTCIVGTKCGHAFHFSCFEQWRKHKNTCPTCRTPFLVHELTTLGEILIL